MTSHSADAQPIASYVAKLGAADHFNSNGKRLTNAAAIIRQDRANFHVLNRPDPQDQWDGFFASKDNRARLERMLKNGSATPYTLSRIINGQPLVRVDIYSNFINITVF